MQPSVQFFPFHPRLMRWGLLAGAVACVVLAAWAMAEAVSGRGGLAWVRAALSAGLGGAMLVLWSRLRPRSDWGIRLQPTALVISGPLTGELTVPWAHIRRVERAKRGRALMLLLRSEQALHIPRSLFESQQSFEAMARAVEEHGPAPGYDA